MNDCICWRRCAPSMSDTGRYRLSGAGVCPVAGRSTTGLGRRMGNVEDVSVLQNRTMCVICHRRIWGNFARSHLILTFSWGSSMGGRYYYYLGFPEIEFRRGVSFRRLTSIWVHVALRKSDPRRKFTLHNPRLFPVGRESYRSIGGRISRMYYPMCSSNRSLRRHFSHCPRRTRHRERESPATDAHYG